MHVLLPRAASGGAQQMPAETLLIILLIGAIAGWLAGQIVQGTGFGLVADIALGIIGAFIGTWLLPQLGIRVGAGIVAAIIAATIGAVVVGSENSIHWIFDRQRIRT
jgi:uncharacterized membrane protein YeaQ/YmgE (transglycosylase-associated protein family)